MQYSSKRTIALAGIAVGGVGVLGVWLAMGTTVLPREALVPEPREREPRPGQTGCPAGAASGGAGPEMARLPEGFCIDTTEVTRAQYEAWLATSPGRDGAPASCAEDGTFEPGCEWPPSSSQGALPVVCVDWCDARAFCEAAGKRLCGRVGDGRGYGFDGHDDAATSEWFAACSSGGRHTYAYGDELDPTRCRGGDAEDHTTWGLTDVGTLAGCQSPEVAYAGVHDLSGNAAEWDDGCEGDAADAPCRIRGGSFEHQLHGLRCAMGQNLRWPRDRQQGAIGFRCCAD